MANYNSFIFEGHGKSEKTGGYDPGATNGGFKENDLADAIRKLIDEKEICSKFSKKLREEKIDTTNEVNKLLDYI